MECGKHPENVRCSCGHISVAFLTKSRVWTCQKCGKEYIIQGENEDE